MGRNARSPDARHLISRRALLQRAAALGVALSVSPISAVGSASAATGASDVDIASNLSSALLPRDLAADAAAQYEPWIAGIDSDVAEEIRASLTAIDSRLGGTSSMSAEDIRAALRRWLPQLSVAPVPTAGDPAEVRRWAKLLAAPRDPKDPSTWALARPCAFNGDASYQDKLALDETALEHGEWLQFITSVVDALAGRALAAQGSNATYFEGVSIA